MLFFKKKKKSWPLVNPLLATPTAFFSITFMKFSLPVTTFLNCLRFKLLRGENQVWANSFFLFSPFTVLFQLHPPRSHLSLLVLLAHYLSNPWTNSYDHLGSPTSSHQFPCLTWKALHIFPTVFPPFQHFIISNPSLPMTIRSITTLENIY